MSSKRLIIVSNRLPFTITMEGEQAVIQPASGGLVSAIQGYIESSKEEVQFDEIIWCGNPGCKAKVWNTIQFPEKDLYQYLPVFTSNKLYNDFYNGFANSTLWPLFHYFPSYSKFNDQYWEAYQRVNDAFAEVLSSEIREGDIVWIHDYHLMILPQLIRERFPAISIGFFLHIPFPTYELIKFIPNQWQEKIIKGLLGSDLIGFHTTEYVAHFLETVQSSLGITHQGLLIPYQNRFVVTDQFPISIHYEEFHEAYDMPLVKIGRKKLIEYFKGQRIIFSIDRLDYTKGISNRILAFEDFLNKHTDYHKNIVFILVIIPSRDKIDKYEERKKMIDESISRVNSSFGTLDWQPIIYRYRSLKFEELITLYTSAELALITPIRDGMNLVAKEFIASRADKKGVLILSELAGAAKELPEAVLINPNDIHDLSDKIYEALKISAEDQKISIEKMQDRIKKFDIKRWSKTFLDKLYYAHQLKKQLYLNDEEIVDSIQKIFNRNQAIKLLVYIKNSSELDELLNHYKTIQTKLNFSKLSSIHFLIDDGHLNTSKNLKSNHLHIHQLQRLSRPQDHVQLNKSLESLKKWFEDYVDQGYKIEIKENKLLIKFTSGSNIKMESLMKSIQKTLQLNHLSTTIDDGEIMFESTNQSSKHQLLEYILKLEGSYIMLIGVSKEQIAYLLENIPDNIKLRSVAQPTASTSEQTKSILQILINK